MPLFFAYIRQRRRYILAFILFCLIFIITFLLYRLPIGAVLYPTVLCGIIGAFFVASDFIRAYKKHRQLSAIKELSAAMMTSLPPAEGMEDEDYIAVIEALRNEVSDLDKHMSTRYSDMVDYYTLWVHQIKTPIASMLLTLENEDTALSRKLRSDLFRIQQYVDMVLAFLRLDSVSSDYVFKEHAVDDIVRQSVAKFASEFIDRKLRLSFDRTEKTIVTDEKWFSFVLEQVISNALKYTREGGIHIYLSENTLCITDTGIGISPEDLPRIFEKGYTGYNGRLDKRASGIGLYLCKRICKNLGTDISVTSLPGKGTTVRIDLTQYELNE